MSQNLSEMLEAWEKSRKKEDTGWMDKSRFYDLRKRPTGRPRDTRSSITPIGEAVLARDLGLDQKNADPMDEA